MDKVISGYDDQMMDITMTVIDKDGSTKSYDYSVYQKGEKRLVRFTSGEVKGMSVLSMSRDRVYVYLPGYKRVRRVAAHNLNQAFVGSDFSQDDMATTEWADSHSVKMEKEDEDFWYLRCIPNKNQRLSYDSALLKVGKKEYRQWRVEYYKNGEIDKTMDNTVVTEFGPQAIRHKNVVMSTPSRAHKTELELKDFKVNLGLTDSMFTVRQLQWSK